MHTERDQVAENRNGPRATFAKENTVLTVETDSLCHVKNRLRGTRDLFRITQWSVRAGLPAPRGCSSPPRWFCPTGFTHRITVYLSSLNSPRSHLCLVRFSYCQLGLSEATRLGQYLGHHPWTTVSELPRKLVKLQMPESHTRSGCFLRVGSRIHLQVFLNCFVESPRESQALLSG